ncbi:MAG: helix-turn-helix domain-containing protein [Alphaproteobacteria bacterium]|nr:helix-turn-helix domain-containing protein [Alphaproteobacteria bacterium]MBP9776232.1 helix-turn-helix domain-containing protein [Alphaproteobacteria bacterium]
MSMLLNKEQCYKAVRSHDLRFDGHFFFGVNATGIYCRPICIARPPKFENCQFFSTAAAAEVAGFRPCLRCRPEQAPGNTRSALITKITQKAMNWIEEGFLNEAKIKELAEKLGVTDRYLRRIFHTELGVSPIAFAQTQRLLLSKRLLIDTTLPITEIAFASGFNSLRRFNVLFKTRYGVNPTSFRRSIATQESVDSLAFDLSYQPPLDWQVLLNFLKEKAIPRSEEIYKGTYRRIVRLKQKGKWHVGWIAVEIVPSLSVLRVIIDIKLAHVILLVLKRVKLLFDLTCSLEKIIPALGPLAEDHPGLRAPGAFDGFEIAVRAILSQHVAINETQALAERIITYFGEFHPTPFPKVTYAFPSPERLSAASLDEFNALEIPHNKAQAIILLAQAIIDKSLILTPNADVSRDLERLRLLPNIDERTIQYIIMRALSWPDAFPYNDRELMKALEIRSPNVAQELTKTWQPWRSYAAMHLWFKLTEKSQ